MTPNLASDETFSKNETDVHLSQRNMAEKFISFIMEKSFATKIAITVTIILVTYAFTQLRPRTACKRKKIQESDKNAEKPKKIEKRENLGPGIKEENKNYSIENKKSLEKITGAEKLEDLLNQEDDFYESEEEDELFEPKPEETAEFRISSRKIEKFDAIKSSSGEKVPLVIDIGSTFTRFGYADAEDRGIEIHRSVVGSLRRQISTKNEKFYGNTAAQKSSLLNLSSLINHDHVDWSSLISLIKTFDFEISAQPIVLTGRLSLTEQQKALQYFMEYEHVSEFLYQSQAVMATYGNGLANGGLSVVAGARGVEIVPVYDGQEIERSKFLSPIGGEIMQERLRVFLRDERDQPLNTFSEKEFLRLAMENNAVFNGTPKIDEVTLPDGARISLADGLRVCTRAIGPEFSEISKALRNCDKDLLESGVFSQCVFSGGLTNMTGFNQGIISSLKTAFDDIRQYRKIWSTRASHRNMRITSFSQPEPELSPWKGAAIIADTSSIRSPRSITESLYKEYGVNILKRY